jgi:hypothetical protein
VREDLSHGNGDWNPEIWSMYRLTTLTCGAMTPSSVGKPRRNFPTMTSAVSPRGGAQHTGNDAEDSANGCAAQLRTVAVLEVGGYDSGDPFRLGHNVVSSAGLCKTAGW